MCMICFTEALSAAPAIQVIWITNKSSHHIFKFRFPQLLLFFFKGNKMAIPFKICLNPPCLYSIKFKTAFVYYYTEFRHLLSLNDQ